jgi:tol-pal system protein YbgF
MIPFRVRAVLAATVLSGIVAASVSGVVFAQAQTAQGVDRDTLLEIVTRMQRLEAEIQALRGQIEVQQNEIETLKRRQRDQYLDIDRRVQQFENLGIGDPIDTGMSGSSPAETMPGTEAGFPEVREPIDAQLETEAIADQEAPGTVALADPAVERAAYEQAFDLLKQQRYEEAARAFAMFLSDYPNGEYADNAQYWLAESNYVQRNFRPALMDFEKVLTDHPASTKVPDAELKIGFIQYEMKDWVRARAVLTQVVSSYPGTTVARLAEDRLRLMRIEGH